MDFKEKIKSLLNQGELYRSQGLLNESKASYKQAIQLIQDQPNVKDAQKVIDGIRNKLNQVDHDIAAIAEAPPPEVPAKIQELIKRQFAFATDDNARALEGAIALAKFGQFEKALTEFEALLDRAALRVDAAKNIVRCHIALKQIDQAVNRYKGWLDAGVFTAGEIARVKMFIETMFKKEGISQALPSPAAQAQPLPSPAAAQAPAAVPEPKPAAPSAAPAPAKAKAAPPAAEEEEILEINTISITIEENRRPKPVELNVSFQSGNTISILVAGRDKSLLDHLQVGAVIEEVQFFSVIAIFYGKAEVLTNTRIESGPRRGDCSVELKVIPG